MTAPPMLKALLEVSASMGLVIVLLTRLPLGCAESVPPDGST